MTVEFKTFADGITMGNGVMEGYASTYGNVDRSNEVVVKGAFGDHPFRVPFLAYHDPKMPIGSATCTPDEIGLRVSAVFANTAKAQEMRELMRVGAVPALSIGYRVLKSSPGAQKGIKELHALDTMEVSGVPIPCNRLALVTAAKSFSLEPTEMDDFIDDMKAGRRNSASDQMRLQAAHDYLVESGAECTTEKAAQFLLSPAFDVELELAVIDTAL